MRNKLFLTGMFGKGMIIAVLAFGLALTGCASFKADPESITSESITLESQDVEALGVGWGYTEKYPYAVAKLKTPATPVYPAAAVTRFTAADKDEVKRECVNIASKTIIPQWKVQEHLKFKNGETWATLSTHPTEREANAAATKLKQEDPDWAFSIEVVRDDQTKYHTYTGLKPLQ